MNIVRTGAMLNTERYDDFQLTCFEFEGSYLMIETEGFCKA